MTTSAGSAPAPKRSASRLVAGIIVALRWPIVIAWIAGAAYATVALPTISQAQVGALGDLVPNGSKAIRAEQRSHDLFGFPVLSRDIVVQRDPHGLSPAAQLRVVKRAAALDLGLYPGLTGIPGALALTNTLGKPPFSREHSTAALTFLFFPPSIGPRGRAGLSRRLIARHMSRPSDHTIGVTGTLPARASQSKIISDRLPLVELITGLLVILLVGLHFRAVAAPLVNALAVAVAYLTAIRVLAVIGKAVGVSIPSEVGPVIVVLLFGVLTDYSIFFLSRFRERLEDVANASASVAAIETIAELLPIVLAAGLTVALASASLVVARLGFFQAFGPGMALSVLVALAVALTFVPAVLAIVGRRLFWPHRSKPAERRKAAEYRRPLPLRLVSRAPALTALVCLVALLAAASGLLRAELGNPVIRGLPKDSEVKRAYVSATHGFTPGILAPTVIVVEGHDIVHRRAALAALQRRLSAERGVAKVLGPADQRVHVELGGALSRTGDAARYALVLTTNPLGSFAIGRLAAIRARMPAALRASGLGGARFLIGGDTALSEELVSGTVSDLARVAPAAMLAVLLVLMVFLRALVAPLYLLASSALAVGAGLGLATYFFQDLLGYGQLSYFVPFAAAVLLVALGSDYNVFLVGRVWREARSVPLREAVLSGASDAAGPIAVAGVVLASSFALLAIVPIRSFTELAFTMAIGLLVDAFLVRTLLVPSLILLAGRASGWPGGRLRRKRAELPA